MKQARQKSDCIRSASRQAGRGGGCGQSGQAAVEYVLIVAIIVSATILLTFLQSNGLVGALQGFFDEIIAYVSLPIP